MPNLRSLSLAAVTLIVFCTGCTQQIWYATEQVSDALIPPTNAWTGSSSTKDLANAVGQPADVRFFGDHAMYMGDKGDTRMVHVRDIFDFWGFLGECDYAIPASQWPMAHPMPFTQDASKWQDVAWMNGDAPPGIEQSVFLYLSPTFPEGSKGVRPETLPAAPPIQSPFDSTQTAPSTTPDDTNPATEPTTSQPASAPTSNRAPTTQPSAAQ